ncbi:MAG: hypothetical protein ABIC68_05240 [Candidatus Omnitrophota bacterium]
MSRTADHSARKKEILSAVIETYLRTAQPVSSEVLRKSPGIELSSASVRNAMSELEEMGYLTHPHTSAGRVPTDEGYRYYINVLMKKQQLMEREADYIDRIYDLKVKELDDLLRETSRILSDFTHYASLVYFDDAGERVYSEGMRHILDHPEFNDLRRAQMVFEILEKKEELLGLIGKSFSDQTVVYIGKESACQHMEHCSVVVSRYDGDSSHECRGRLALVGPRRMAYDRVIPLMDYLCEVIERNMERF